MSFEVQSHWLIVLRRSEDGGGESIGDDRKITIDNVINSVYNYVLAFTKFNNQGFIWLDTSVFDWWEKGLVVKEWCLVVVNLDMWAIFEGDDSCFVDAIKSSRGIDNGFETEFVIGANPVVFDL